MGVVFGWSVDFSTLYLRGNEVNILYLIYGCFQNSGLETKWVKSFICSNVKI